MKIHTEIRNIAVNVKTMTFQRVKTTIWKLELFILEKKMYIWNSINSLNRNKNYLNHYNVEIKKRTEYIFQEYLLT